MFKVGRKSSTTADKTAKFIGTHSLVLQQVMYKQFLVKNKNKLNIIYIYIYISLLFLKLIVFRVKNIYFLSAVL